MQVDIIKLIGNQYPLKTTLVLSLIFLINLNALAQEKKPDTLKVETLDEVLVKAIRVDASSPITHSNIDKKAIEKRNLGQDLPILLNFLPSVVSTSDAGAGIGYTGIRIRGVSAQSTNITINGIPYNDAESLGTFWVDLPDFSSSIENLQVQRGIGSSTNGAGAFGASINILTEALAAQAQGSIATSLGSYNSRKHNLQFNTGLISDHIEISGRLSKISSDGYIDRASSDLKSYFLQGTFFDENTLIKGLVFGGHEITYQAWNGIDGETLENDRTFNSAGMYSDDQGQIQFYDNEVDNYKQDHTQLHWHERLNQHWSTHLALNYTRGKGYFEQYKEDEDFEAYNFEEIAIGGQTINTTDLIRRRWLDNKYYVINLNTNYRDQKFNIHLGSSLSSYRGDHFGEVIWASYAANSSIRDRYYNGNSLKNEFNLFTKATYKFNTKLSFFADLQWRNIQYKTQGTNSDRNLFELDKSYNFFNPKIGLSYQLDGLNNFYFSIAKASREPSRGDFKNSLDIKPEKLINLELGYRYKAKDLLLSTNLYYMLYNEQLVLTGALDDVGNPLRANSGKSYRLGLEIEATLSLSKALLLQPNITLSSNKNKQVVVSNGGALLDLGQTNLSFSPNIIAANALVYNPAPDFQLSLLSKYVGQQYMGNTDSEISKLKSYFVNDLSLSYEIKTSKIFKSILFSVLVNNVLNAKYVANGYYYTYDDDFSVPGTISTIEGSGYYPQATRNFLLGLNLKF